LRSVFVDSSFTHLACFFRTITRSTWWPTLFLRVWAFFFGSFGPPCATLPGTKPEPPTQFARSRDHLVPNVIWSSDSICTVILAATCGFGRTVDLRSRRRHVCQHFDHVRGCAGPTCQGGPRAESRQQHCKANRHRFICTKNLIFVPDSYGKRPRFSRHLRCMPT
jgi:hypothetical protein